MERRDPDRAGEVGLPATSGRDDEQVRGVCVQSWGLRPVVGRRSLSPHGGDAPSFLEGDLGNGGVRDGEPCTADEIVDPVVPPLLQSVIDGGEEQLLGMRPSLASSVSSCSKCAATWVTRNARNLS